MISWRNLLKYFEDVLLPNNDKQFISPLKLRTAFKMLMDALETVFQFATPTPTQQSIVVLFSTARSWPITLSGASNTIGEFAFTSRSKRTLIKGTDFVVTGQGLNRIFSISNQSIDDFVPGEEIVYIENVKGSILNLNLPIFSVVNQNGVDKYAWKLEGQSDDQLQILNNVPSPYLSSAVLFNHPQLGQINVAAALQDLLDRQDKVVNTQAELVAAFTHPVPRMIIYPDVGMYYKIPGLPPMKLVYFNPPQS